MEARGAVSEQAALERNILSGVVSILACIGTILVIDKIGRKPLLLIGSAGMAVSLFAMAFAFHSGTLDPSGKLQLTHNMGMVALVAANLYVIFFNGTWGPVMWVMLGEMFPEPDPRLRTRGRGICAMVRQLPDRADIPDHG